MTNAVITTTGPDKPGVSAAFFRVLGSYNVELVDVEQALFSGRISLSAYVDLNPNRLEDIEQGLRNTLSIYQQQISAELSDALPRSRSTHAVVVMGRPLTASHLSSVAQELANFNVNIDRIRGLSQEPVTALDLSVTVPGEEESLRKALAALSAQLGIDIAVESAGLSRRSRRLICFDCDSTLITGEVIEMLAAHAGKEAEVAAVTERAMRGELDFEHSLRERVATLAGLPASVIDETAASLTLTPGVRTTIRTLKNLGYRVAVVSGGFIQVLEGLAKELDLDYVRANTLEIEDGKLTGRVIGKVVDRQAKEDFLREFAADAGISMSRTIAVGDGANDIDMITAAGLGIAFNAKPALREVADAQVNHPYMDEILQILGIPSDDVVRAEDAE
ncbi:phosphoserine phosphatase SerB [Corynebacterium sp. CMW7794]|uniref:phosphoserine phosphatase n=1 Tax=Corynebacterium phoceense TaxID=1686286 RepID=A0A540R7D7_9CORY|nr:MULTISPECIES: phosphoserine phosphatase SerB [Corynebacterium]KXI17345.1 phosphoserine phosphatase SerB [Corynebacterium sp. CMW7794]OFL77808.1 phosphoserine phosphatase [Corynebacterium sp. HMSC077B05]OFN40544.1 phosphoserine phosphatase [Corynebacterium sp. HMSC072G08]OFP20273.1 phosphoserine phosphatase [Corynebacterium sp. HMSC065A05]OFP64734.1 phosphoserine phosphatase [Corynebacterium sp. HMSC077D10]